MQVQWRSVMQRSELRQGTRREPANQSTSRSSVDPHAGLVSIHPPAQLSPFEVTVGKLMVQARRGCPTKYLPLTEISKITVLLDDKNIPLRSNLEREASRSMAEYNQRHPASAVKSWSAALRLPQFRRAVRKRFSRAEEKYKKATPHVAAEFPGTTRTGF
jgi:hypothetical protein